MEILGFLAPGYERERYLGRPVFRDPARVEPCDAFVITDLEDPAGIYERLCSQVDKKRILVPDILEWRPGQAPGTDKAN